MAEELDRITDPLRDGNASHQAAEMLLELIDERSPHKQRHA